MHSPVPDGSAEPHCALPLWCSVMYQNCNGGVTSSGPKGAAPGSATGLAAMRLASPGDCPGARFRVRATQDHGLAPPWRHGPVTKSGHGRGDPTLDELESHLIPRLTCLTSVLALVAGTASAQMSFTRVASFATPDNMAEGEDRAAETSAEIIAASGDGMTLIYTDSPLGVVGWWTSPIRRLPSSRATLL